jgi:PilZ domain-containing protein
MSNERRRNFRVEWNSPATIYDLERDLVRPCILANFSNTGARITGVLASTIPDEFMLRITGGRRGTRKCRVLWRSNNTLGVEFTDYKTIDADVSHEARERA